MTLEEGIRRRVIGAALVIGIVMWSTWFFAVATGGFERDVDGNILGVDHSVFHTAGVMVTSGRGADLYDPTSFSIVLSEVRGGTGAAGLSFLNPPGLAYVFAPTAQLGQQSAWLAFSAAGLLAMALALRLVGVNRAWLATVFVVGTLPALLNLRLGQLAFFWAAILGLVYWFLQQDRQVAAGLVAALLVFKPQFALAVGLWWLVSGVKHRRALVTMSVTGAIITLAAFLWTPRSFSGFWDASLRTLDSSTFPSGFSIKDTIAGLGPAVPAVLVALLTVGVGAAVVLVVHHRCGDDLPAMFAAGVFAAVWIPSHLLAYDWVLLAVAIGALWAARPAQRRQWTLVAALLASWAFAAWAIALIAHSLLGIRLELAAVGLAVIAWWSFRALLIQPATAEAAGSRTLPVNV